MQPEEMVFLGDVLDRLVDDFDLLLVGVNPREYIRDSLYLKGPMDGIQVLVNDELRIACDQDFFGANLYFFAPETLEDITTEQYPLLHQAAIFGFFSGADVIRKNSSMDETYNTLKEYLHYAAASSRVNKFNGDVDGRT